MKDPVKLLLVIAVVFTTLGILVGLARHRHEHDPHELEIGPEPSPARMPTGLPRPLAPTLTESLPTPPRD